MSRYAEAFATVVSARRAVHGVIRRSRGRAGGRAFRVLPEAICAAGLAAVIADTAMGAGSRGDLVLRGIVAAAWVFFVATYALRVWLAPEELKYFERAAARARLCYMRSPSGVIDLMAALALPAGWLAGLPPRDAQLLAVVWVLKFLRRSSRLSLLWRVLTRALPALVTVVTVFVVVLLIAATLAYALERESQPQTFGSIPHALWWAIVTLTTTGYGDVVPATTWGRVLGGWMMVSGIVIFALWAGIIANAFADELRRRHFLTTWDLVADVPFFASLGPAAIADIVHLLRPLDVAAGTVLVREGERGDAMYFIVSGEACANVAPEPVYLGPGAFFGEMALLYGAPRSTTVLVTRPSVLLVLDVADFRVLAGRRPELARLIEDEARRRQQSNLAHQV